jgi:hypothetical protein
MRETGDARAVLRLALEARGVRWRGRRSTPEHARSPSGC